MSEDIDFIIMKMWLLKDGIQGDAAVAMHDERDGVVFHHCLARSKIALAISCLMT